MAKVINFGEPGWEKYNSDANKWYPQGESLTEQSHKDACDINVMMAHYEKNGIVPRSPDGQLFFGDFTGIQDYQSAQNAVIDAMDSFMQLPAKVRSRFDNDPGKLLMFLEDASNRDEAVKLGLIDDKVDVVVEPPVVPAAPV